MASLRKLKSGKWQVIIRKKHQPQIIKSFIDKSTARKYGKDVEARMDRNIFEDYSGAMSTTFKDLIIKYRDEIVPEQKAAKPTTHKLNLLARQKIAYLNLMQIKASHIYELKRELSVGRKPKTVKIYIQLLSQIWNTAKRNFNITLPAESPFALVPMARINDTRDRVLDKDEYDRLLKAAGASKLLQLHDLIKFAYLTGARYGEIVRLRKANVDFNKQTCTFVDTKNGEDRTIPLHNSALEILKRYPFGETYFRMKPDSFRFYFKQAREKAGLENFRFHDLRGCFCTNALLSGMSIAEVSTLSGHKSWSMLKRYTRIKPQDLLLKVNNVINFK